MIARKTTLMVLQHGIGMFIGYIAMKLISVELGPDEIGMVSLGFSTVAIFNFLTNLGYNPAHMKKISEGKDLGTCIGTFIVVKLLLTALMALIFLSTFSVWMFLYPSSLQDTTTEILMISLVYHVFFSLAQIALVTFDARTETSKSQLSFLLTHPVKFIALLFVIFTAPLAAHGKFNTDITTANQLSLAYYLSVAVVLFIVAWAIFLVQRYPVSRPTMEMFKDYTHFALPVFVSSILNVLILNMDKLMLGFFWDNIAVGQYFMVQRLSMMILVVPQSLALVLLPILSNLDSKKNPGAIRKVIIQSERHISMILAPIMLFILFMSRPLIHLLLSDDFLEADFAFAFLGIYAFAQAMNATRGTLFRSIGRPGIVAKVAIVRATINFILNILLIPNWFDLAIVIPGSITPSGYTHTITLYHVTGAAIATLSSSLVGFILLRLLSWRMTKTVLYHGFTVKHMFAGILMSTVLVFLYYTIGMARWYHLLMFIGIGLGIYLGLLFIMKEFGKKEIRFYLGLLNPRTMKRYMSEELKEKDLGVAMRTLSDGFEEE